MVAIKPALVIVLVCAAMSLAAAAAPTSLSVTVVGVDDNDPRWHAVAEAVEFWNQLADAGVGVRLGPIARLVQPIPDDVLRQLSEVAVASRFDRDIPKEFERIPGDIVVALSMADLVSFGLQRSPERKGLVGLRRADIPPMSLPNVLRNVVAHELGHALGLRHNSDPATLMCGRPAPCRPPLFASDTNHFFPLTEADKAVLRARW